MYEDDDQEPYDQRDETYTSSEDDIDEDDPSSRYCEVCDREFETPDLLRKHVDTHKTCDIDGCTFSAHPKLVEKHIQMQHRTGLYHRMKNLSTPEDIEKWIIERKKKYPTKTAVESKNAERLEKIERGEIIEKQKIPRESKKPVREKKRRARKRRTRESAVEPGSKIELYRGLLPFSGTAKLRAIVDENEKEEFEIEKIEDHEFLNVTCPISDDEDESNSVPCNQLLSPTPETPPEQPKASPVVENESGLASLMANYGSDSGEDEAPEEIPIKRLKMDIPTPSETLEAQESLDKTTIIEPEVIEKIPEVKVDNRKNPKSTRNLEKSTITEQSSNLNNNINNNRHYSQKRLMLLQRLLSRSIQHERNLICQCIKFIADNNFFE